MLKSRKAAILVVLVFSVCLAVAGVRADEQGGSAPAQPALAPVPAPVPALTGEELQARIGKLILQLGSSVFEEREAAQKELMEIGEPARAQLAKALKSEDKEITYRATQVLIDLNLAHVTLEFVDKQGNPIADRIAEVSVERPFFPSMEGGMMPPEPTEVKGALGADGKVALEPLEAGNYHVTVRVAGYCARQEMMTFGKGKYARRMEMLKGATVRGKVVDAMNGDKPLAGLRLVVYAGSAGSEEFVTDEKGEFVMGNIQPSLSTLHVEAKGQAYVMAKSEEEDFVQVSLKDEETTEVAIGMMEQKWLYGKAEGRVFTPDGKAYDGFVDVTYRVEDRDRRGGNSGGERTKDAEGRFEIGNMKRGKYMVVIRVEGYAPRVLKGVEVKGNVPTRLPDITLDKGTAVKVKVVADGKPVEGAIVMLSDVNDAPRVIEWYMMRGGSIVSYSPWDTGKADKDGGCEFAMFGGKYAVRAYYEGGGASEETVIEVKDGEPVSIEISCKAATMIMLSVVDKETGKAVEKVQGGLASGMTRERSRDEVDAAKGHIQITENRYGDAEKDDKGRFHLKVSDKGDTLLVGAEGYKPAAYHVGEMPEGKVTEATLEMEKIGTGDLKATLVLGKGMKLAGIAEAYVNTIDTLFYAQIEDPQAIFLRWGTKVAPGAGGVIEAKALNEGMYYVSMFAKDGRMIAVFRVNIEKGKTVEVKFNVPGLGKVEGALTDSAGVVMPGVEVTLMPDSLTMSLGMMLLMSSEVMEGMTKLTPTAIADENGHFVFNGVPEGDYVLMPEGQGGAPEVGLVHVTAGETAKGDMQLHEPMEVGLTFKNKTMPWDVLLLAQGSAGPLGLIIPPRIGSVVQLNEGDTPKLAGIRPGKYTLIMMGNKPFGALQAIEVTPETKSIEVDMSPVMGPLAVRGKITRMTDVLMTPAGIGMVLAIGERSFAFGYVFADGSFEIRGLMPGKYRLWPVSLDELCVNRAELMHFKEVTLEEGKNLEGVEIP